jgi:hypothetical protein
LVWQSNLNTSVPHTAMPPKKTSKGKAKKADKPTTTSKARPSRRARSTSAEQPAPTRTTRARSKSIDRDVAKNSLFGLPDPEQKTRKKRKGRAPSSRASSVAATASDLESDAEGPLEGEVRMTDESDLEPGRGESSEVLDTITVEPVASQEIEPYSPFEGSSGIQEREQSSDFEVISEVHVSSRTHTTFNTAIDPSFHTDTTVTYPTINVPLDYEDDDTSAHGSDLAPPSHYDHLHVDEFQPHELSTVAEEEEESTFAHLRSASRHRPQATHEFEGEDEDEGDVTPRPQRPDLYLSRDYPKDYSPSINYGSAAGNHESHYTPTRPQGSESIQDRLRSSTQDESEEGSFAESGSYAEDRDRPGQDGDVEIEDEYSESGEEREEGNDGGFNYADEADEYDDFPGHASTPLNRHQSYHGHQSSNYASHDTIVILSSDDEAEVEHPTSGNSPAEAIHIIESDEEAAAQRPITFGDSNPETINPYTEVEKQQRASEYQASENGGSYEEEAEPVIATPQQTKRPFRRPGFRIRSPTRTPVRQIGFQTSATPLFSVERASPSRDARQDDFAQTREEPPSSPEEDELRIDNLKGWGVSEEEMERGKCKYSSKTITISLSRIRVALISDFYVDLTPMARNYRVESCFKLKFALMKCSMLT